MERRAIESEVWSHKPPELPGFASGKTARYLLERRAFGSEVRSHKPPDLPDFALEEAIAYFVDIGQTSRSDIRKCIQLAGVISRAILAQGPKTKSGLGEFVQKLSPDRLITSEYILKLIRPDVEAVRRKLFGNPDPPFKKYKEAIAWFERESRKKGKERTLEKVFDRSYRKWVRHAAQLQKLTAKCIVSPRLKARIITYVKPGDEWTHSVPVRLGTPLATLEDFLRKAEKRTGFPQPALVIHVLTPIPLVLPRWSLSYTPPVGEYKPRGLFTVKIIAQTVSWEDMRTIYKAINWTVGRSRASILDETDQVLLGVMKRLGGIPARGKMEYWRRVAEECRRQGATSLRSGHAARIRSKRLARKRAGRTARPARLSTFRGQ